MPSPTPATAEPARALVVERPARRAPSSPPPVPLPSVVPTPGPRLGVPTSVDVPADPTADAVADLGRLRRAVGMLRAARTPVELVAGVPTATAVLGFDLALYAHLHGPRWIPAAGHGADGRPRTLDRTWPEWAALTGHVPVVVDPSSAGSVSGWPGVTVVAVPVLDRGVAIGLLHAGPVRASSVEVDRQLLGTFAEALGALLVAARAVGSLHDIASRTTELVGAFARPAPPGPGPLPLDPGGLHPDGAGPDGVGPDGVGPDGVEPGGPARARRVPADTRPADAAASRPGPPTALTDRESDVLALVAAGSTNAQIARRLVITEGTAKSHLKRILRKLGAANRAEAAAAWTRMSPGGAAVR